uniref:Uncharacterized protein n=1 Tax=Anguilla anguilla TaxID=7936 RepID=A0A0E9RE24_ANGAN
MHQILKNHTVINHIQEREEKVKVPYERVSTGHRTY